MSLLSNSGAPTAAGVLRGNHAEVEGKGPLLPPQLEQLCLESLHFNKTHRRTRVPEWMCKCEHTHTKHRRSPLASEHVCAASASCLPTKAMSASWKPRAAGVPAEGAWETVSVRCSGLSLLWP